MSEEYKDYRPNTILSAYKNRRQINTEPVTVLTGTRLAAVILSLCPRTTINRPKLFPAKFWYKQLTIKSASKCNRFSRLERCGVGGRAVSSFAVAACTVDCGKSQIISQRRCQRRQNCFSKRAGCSEPQNFSPSIYSEEICSSLCGCGAIWLLIVGAVMLLGIGSESMLRVCAN